MSQDAPTHDGHAAGIINRYCGGCHSRNRSDIVLEGLLARQAVRGDRAHWQRVMEALRNRTMPPKRYPQLQTDERQAVLAWLDSELKAAPQEQGAFRLRRLRSEEYHNMVRDLFGAATPRVEDFPEDDHGWTCADRPPSLPGALLDRYRRSAERLVAALDLDALVRRTPAVLLVEEPQRDSALLLACASRAYRRSLTEPEAKELETLLADAVTDGATPAEALRVGLQHVLCSPRFLFRSETRHAPGTLCSEWELAERLSFLLWSSGPDAELQRLAEEGRLRPNLAQQLRRMLVDPRARALAAGLADTWLELGRLNEAQLEPSLLNAARQETVELTAWIVREDRCVLDFVDAKVAFLNEQLAQHYGIPDVKGAELRPVSLAGTPRAGVLTQASILALTSLGGHASPVQRGRWVLANLLGTPPPVPPRGLLSALNQTRKGFARATVRERLVQHRTDAACAHCHMPIDGLGAALESFDETGAWLGFDRPSGPDDVLPLPDGENLQGPEDLRRYVLKHRAKFLRGLASRLLTYALERRLQEDETVALEDALRQLPHDPSFSSVVLAIVASVPFQQGPTR